LRYERFEQLPVWQASIELAVQIYTLTGTSAFRRQYSLRDQLERAAVSLSNNIAERFERGTRACVIVYWCLKARLVGTATAVTQRVDQLGEQNIE
jgi:23S rRNA-intervening sequence protein